MRKEKCARDEIIRHLRKHKSITSYEAIKKYGVTRLSGVIYVLRERGFVIETEIKCGKNRYGHISNYAIYHLIKDVEDDVNDID